MNLSKKTKLSFIMAILLLLPLLNRIIETGFLFLLLSLVLLGIAVLRGARRELFQFASRWDMLCMAALFVLSVLGLVLKLMGVLSAKGHTTSEFMVVISVIIFCFALRTQSGWDKNCLQVPVIIGLWIMVLYFADTALFPGLLSLFDRGVYVIDYTNMVAFLTALMAAGLYVYTDDKVMRPVYVAGMVMSALVIGINEAWGTAFLIFIMLVIHSVTIVPVAEIMKRLLQLFFGLALLFCNMSLLVNYTDVIHVKGLEYRLECGVIGELFLCLLALYVFKRWDKIPEGMDLRRIKLSRLQRGCRCFFKIALRLLVILILLSLIDGKLEPGNIVQLFAGEQWEDVSSDTFVIALLSLFSHMYEALAEMWTGNLFAVFYQLYGWIGAAAAMCGFGLLCYRLYFVVWRSGDVDELLAWDALGAVMAMAVLPVSVYMLPLYLMFAMLAVYIGREAESNNCD